MWRVTLDAKKADKIDYHNPPHVGLATVIPLYACPSDGRLSSPITADGFTAAYCSYVGVMGGKLGNDLPLLQRGALQRLHGVPTTAITDGASNTLLVGERPPPRRKFSGTWYGPLAAPIRPGSRTTIGRERPWQ